MQLSDFEYELPDAAIAIHPPEIRGATRLLVLDKRTGAVQDSRYADLTDFLQAGDVLVINNTRVIPARLLAHTEGGAERELLLLEKHGKSDDHHTSLVMYRRKLRDGQKLTVGDAVITIEDVYPNGTAKISSPTDLWELAEDKGTVPLPPYMHRAEEAGDRERYQTTFAKERGSVAAPTASLNLTDELLEKIKAKGVEIVELTLHVGLGTFMPIRVDDVTKHKMHQEYFVIPDNSATAIQKAKEQGRRVVAVGTTVTRTLEYAAKDIMAFGSDPDVAADSRTAELEPSFDARTRNANEAYTKYDESVPQVRKSKIGQEGGQDLATPETKPPGSAVLAGEADIFIYPGYKFQMVDALVTNFHAPHSTVLMMAAAFAGWEHLRASYVHALKQNYDFLSYGDSMFIQ